MAASTHWVASTSLLLEEVESDDLLDALGDEVAREILVAGKQGPVTAEELADSCGVSESTIYRRLDRLNELGLVERCNPLLSASKGSYQTRIDGLSLAVDEEGISIEQGPNDSKLDAMETVLDVVDVQRVNYDAEDDLVDVQFKLDPELFETFMRVYSQKRDC
ncbi:ArsR/SmtB family transcription factor [Halogeometricum limi]|uniref:Helix-turn-helix domain-containing protein n=1 Tax=Halogeometricum limi TaxID=555875 RepID=A0A1I6G359_9EURY|nr:HTH domain-containing protein [Halogeometricum limi]SFR36634.1 Helix-turn-helix domain-containing protein [Halogeometricum limi]